MNRLVILSDQSSFPLVFINTNYAMPLSIYIIYLSVPTLSVSIISFTHLELSRLHLNSVETIIFINHPHHIVSNVYVWTKDEETIDIPFEHLKATRVNYPNNCRSLALKSIPAQKLKK